MMNEKEFVKTITESRHCGKVFIGNELTRDEEELARENNLVVVFGYSDDCAEFRGAYVDEVDCFDGGRVFEKNGFYIDAMWCIGNTAWRYDTNIPHESFMVWDNDGTAYCLAIVFSMDLIDGKQDNTSEINKAAIEYYGAEMQENQCIEECAELIQAINKKHRGREHNIPEEIADVEICLEQLKMINNCADEVERYKTAKTERLKARIGK